MQADAVPEALAEQLGPEATGGLLELLDRAFDEQRAEMITAVTERFERRMVEEFGSVRLQVARTEAALRQDMASVRAEIAMLASDLRSEMTTRESGLRQDMSTLESGVRQDMSRLESGLREDMSKLGAGLRQDMSKLESGLHQDMSKLEIGLRQEIGTNRFELLKWSFMFWVGQVLVMTAIIGVMLRLYRP